MWVDRTDETVLTDDELFGRLKEWDRQIVLIEGPSGCGKTRLLQRLSQEDSRQTMIFQEDRFIRFLLADLCSEEKGKPFHEFLQDYGVVCVEDIDLLSGKEYTQEAAAQCLSQAARGTLIILTGIRLQERVETLISKLEMPVHLIEFRQETN